MLFSSLIFLFAFLPIVLILYYIVFRSRTWKNICLTVASLLFYAWGEPRFVIVMVISVFTNYILGLLAYKYSGQERKVIGRFVIAGTVILNLALLGYYKYMDFLFINVNLLFNTDIPLPHIALPIGISFFTFQAMSYVFDVYRGDGVAQKNPMNVMLYVSFFPQLIAGPIVRYSTVAKQITTRKENFSLFSKGTQRLLEGLAKKVLISNSLALIADKAFDTVDYSTMSVTFAILGVICYTLQIYYDFSGYSDMAVGLGLMFGFEFLENFDYPYISRSISEFWRRWHISLGSWFRDYVYFPLGGSRVNSKVRLLFNLFVVWFLTGIWHGASWNFLAWGLMYFVFIAFEKLSNIPKRLKHSASKALYGAFTLVVVMLGWVLFRAAGLMRAMGYFQSLFGLNGNPLYDVETWLYCRENIFVLAIAIVFATPVIPYCVNKIRCLSEKTEPIVSTCYTILHSAVLLASFLIVVSYLVNGSYNPFIYFNF